MTKQELKAKIDKLENGIKSKATPSNLIAPLKAQKAKLEKELEDMEAAEKKAVKTKKVSKVAEKIKAAKTSVAKKTPAKAPAKEERKKDNIVRDGDRKSLPAGKRISKTGKVYYEMRANRTDKQTSKKPYLAKGGKIFKRKKFVSIPVKEGDFFFDKPNAKSGYYNYRLVKSVDGKNTTIVIADRDYNGKINVQSQPFTVETKYVQNVIDDYRKEQFEKEQNIEEGAFNLSKEIGADKAKGGDLSIPKVRAQLYAILKKLASFEENVKDSSVGAAPNSMTYRASQSGTAISVDTNNIYRGGYYEGSTPYILQVKVGGALSSEKQTIIMMVLKDLLSKYTYTTELGSSRVKETEGTNWSAVMLTAPSRGDSYSTLRRLDDFKSIRSMEYAKGGEVSKKYVVFFTRLRNGKLIPRVVEMYDNESDAKEYVENQKKLGEKGFKIKQAKDMPIYSMINIVDKSKYKELKDLIHSKDKVDAFFDGKDSFYKKDYGWVKPYGYVWENWKLVSAPNETMAKGGKMADGGDIYDDMEQDIDFANDKAKKIVNSLESLGYKVVKLHEADYDTDAQIDLSEKVNIQVGLEGDLSIVIEKEEGKFTYIDCGKSYATLLIKLSNIDKQYMEKGGKTKRTVKLTLSDKDSYDYTYKQDGATASITFGFGKEPFQYEVKKISKSLEPLQQDILDTFTLQGIKQHEYKGGFSEAIKHLDTSILENADEFAKGGYNYNPSANLKENEYQKLYNKLKERKDKGETLDKREEYAFSKAEYVLKTRGLLNNEDKMAKGGVIKISLSDIEGADFQSLSQIFESNDTDFSVDEDEEFVLMDLKGLPDGEDKEQAYDIIGKYKVKKMADGGKTDEDIDLQIEKDMNSAIKKRDEYQSELKKLLDEKSQDSGHIEYLSYEIESLNKLAKKLHDIRLKRLRDKALPKGNPFKKMAHGGEIGYMISKRGNREYPEYVIEKTDGSELIPMFFDSEKEAIKYAKEKGYNLTKKGYNMNYANGGDTSADYEQYMRWIRRYDLLSDTYYEYEGEEKERVLEEMKELESKINKYERSKPQGFQMADGGKLDKYNVSFNYNPSNLSNEDAERIVSSYTKDWRHNNDFDEVSFYVMSLNKSDADMLVKELKMEDVYNIEVDKSNYASGGYMAKGGKLPNYSAVIVHGADDEYGFGIKEVEFYADNDAEAREKAMATFKSKYPKLDGAVEYVERKTYRSFYSKGGKVPAHFGSGKNINVFGYQTENFDICGTAVKEFESAAEIMKDGKETYKESLARCAKYIDGLFGIEKYVVENTDADDANFYEAVSDVMSASIYNYRAEMSINLFSFVPQHLKEIAIRMAKAEKGGLYALGGMTAGRWYRDKSGEEFKFIGKIDSGENKGKFLFTDGQKSVYKDLEDFEGGRPKETKLFGFFEDGGKMEFGGMLIHGFQTGDTILDIYKGYGIVENNNNGVIEVLNPNRGTRFIIDLDESKPTGEKSMGMSKEEQLKSAKEYIDYLDNPLPDTLLEKYRAEGKMADGGSVAEGNYEMLMSNIKAIKHHAEELEGAVNQNTQIEAWVLSKSERAETDLSDITHYLDGLKMEKGGYMADGGKLSKKSFFKKYEENEDQNMHTENVVLLAENYGTESDIRDAKTILAKHEAIGHLPTSLREERDNLHDKLWSKYIQSRENDGYVGHYGEQKEYLFNFNNGGWNSIIAPNKKQAIKLAKAKYEDTDGRLKVDESTFRIKTEKDYKKLWAETKDSFKIGMADGGVTDNDKKIVKEEMEKFVSLAKLSKDGRDFIDKARKIQVNSATSDWFFSKYDDLDMNKAAQRFVDDVKSGQFNIEMAYGGYMADGGYVANDISEMSVSSSSDGKYTLSGSPIGMTAYEFSKKLQQSNFDLTGIELDPEYSKFFAHGSKSDIDRLHQFLRFKRFSFRKSAKSKMADGGYMAKGGKLKIGGEDFSYLLELSDKELSKRLDLVRKQQDINGKQYFEAKSKNESTQKIEDSRKNLDNQERAIIEARARKMAKGGYMAEGGVADNWKKGTTTKFKTRKDAQRSLDLMKNNNESGTSFQNLKVEKVNDGWVVKFDFKDKMASGGKVKFADKVKSVQESLLKRKKVAPQVQKDYGKTYSKAEAKESAQRIVGSRMAQLKEKMAKKKK